MAGNPLTPDREPLEWRSRPWRGSVAAIALVALLFACLAGYAALVAKDGVWTGLTVVAALYVLSPLLVPVRYRVDEAGISRQSWLTTRLFGWARFGAWRLTPNRRVAVLRFAGKGIGRFAGGMSLFLPEEPLLERVIARLSSSIGPEGGAAR